MGRTNQANIVITNSGADIGPLAVKVNKVQGHAGVAFENCQFMSGLEIGEENLGPVKLTNCGFWGAPGSGSHIINKGQGTVFLTATHFSSWGTKKGYVWDPEIPFIKMLNGSLLMSNSLFKDYGNDPDYHIYLGENVKSAAIIGNRVQDGRLRIKNESKDDVQVIGNLSE